MMRFLSRLRKPFLLATMVLAGCGGNGDVPVAKRALLPAGAEVDLIPVSEAVWAREAAHGFDSLSRGERVFLCVWNLEAEVNNGGFAQFYVNSAGDKARETPSALREIGATQAAAIVEEANRVFGPQGPPADRDARTQALERLGATTTGALSTLDAKFYEYPDDLEELLRQFVERNRDDFYEPP
jgi:hypothetical protein